jgi:transposase
MPSVKGTRDPNPAMSASHDPRQYMVEAAKYREKAAAMFNSPELRESYLALARSYELLVDGLAKREPSTFGRMASAHSYELTDFEWEVIGPLLPNKTRAPRVDDRRVLNGIFWVLGTGSPWEAMPKEFGRSSTCHMRLVMWRKAGVWNRVLTALTKAYDNMQMNNSALVRVLRHAANTESTSVRVLRHATNSINGTRTAVRSARAQG